ncbi:Mth938-like domain-containing protein [Thiomicrorhabdus cannonii]|uniref:Mth938-like domain-containing protein n=1 Tax=Thiomicrorhabdus cannonii TaxID=2748011 RepID=UPI0015C1BA48|nr:Mth938-like domain-containing protein [Thiomicrorhabdus cannonii]
MKFTEHRDSNVYVVKHYEPGEVKINDRRLQKSCFLNQKTLVENWPCAHIDALTTDHLDALLALKPEVILLGTGETQVFPAPQLFAYCSAKGVGLEVMHNLAACRTYNVLTTEDREVVLALIMDADGASAAS